jgi:hypothetical protein
MCYTKLIGRHPYATTLVFGMVIGTGSNWISENVETACIYYWVTSYWTSINSLNYIYWCYVSFGIISTIASLKWEITSLRDSWACDLMESVLSPLALINSTSIIFRNSILLSICLFTPYCTNSGRARITSCLTCAYWIKSNCYSISYIIVFYSVS